MDKLTKIIVEHTITCLMFLIVGINSLCAQELEAPLVHTVLFWLHHPESKDDQLLFEKAINKLIKTNPQKINGYLGKPAKTKMREVVDSSYTYFYQMTFENAEAEAAYQVDSTHLIFIKEAEHLWKKVIVYDAFPLLYE